MTFPESLRSMISREMLKIHFGTSFKTHLLSRHAWVAQLVECPALDFGSGHDLTVREFEPRVGLHAGHGGCLGFSLSLFLSPSSLCKVKNCLKSHLPASLNL